MHYFQGDVITTSMVGGLVFLGMAGMGLMIRVGVIIALMYQRANNPNPEYQTLKKLVLFGQGLLLVSLTAFCGTLYFSLNIPLYVVVLAFFASLVFTVLSTWIWDRKIKRWLS